MHGVGVIMFGMVCWQSTLNNRLTYLLTCYLYVDRLVKLHQLLTPTSFQWSSNLFLNILMEVDVTSLVIFSVKIHVKLSHDSLFAVKIFIDFSEN